MYGCNITMGIITTITAVLVNTMHGCIIPITTITRITASIAITTSPLVFLLLFGKGAGRVDGPPLPMQKCTKIHSHMSCSLNSYYPPKYPP